MSDIEPLARHGLRAWAIPLLLIALTFLTTFWAGAEMHEGVDLFTDVRDLWRGWDFAIPLMAILLAHEMGHYSVARWHGDDISPPYFVPMPPPLMLGTMGAVISIRRPIEDRDALLDMAVAGPLAGLVVAIPVLVWGVMTSPIEPMLEGAALLMEGRSLLYLAILHAVHGPIPSGHDIMLNPTAFAGWAGLLVTMMNLLPYGQLDGGHIAYALFGPRQDQYARRVLFALPVVAALTGLGYAGAALFAGKPFDVVGNETLAGMHWMVWFIVLMGLSKFSGAKHPPVRPGALSPQRRGLAVIALVLFGLLFMPSWIRAV